MRAERGVHKTDGSRGWADVWLKGRFAWEYKKATSKAYRVNDVNHRQSPLLGAS